jgi:UDP-N-acetyl-D-glucosamine dehydrogenase
MPTDRKPEFFKGAQLKVGIIGCGYVGLPLALRFAEAGHKVTGFDTDPKKVSMLNAGKSYIEHIQQNKIQQFVNSKHFGATTDFEKLKECDAIIICVPTPLDERREPDLSYVEQTALSIQPNLQKGQLVVLESTTYPGTTEELVLPILEKNGFSCKIAVGPQNENIPCDFFLAFSPEREDPGNKQYGLAQIPKVVGGINPPSTRAALALYAQVVAKVVPVSSTRAAEMAKLLENIFPLREYRAGERAENAQPAHEYRYLGSHRCGRHQALRIYAFLSGSWLRRTLHPGRSFLSLVESARIRFLNAVH